MTTITDCQVRGLVLNAMTNLNLGREKDQQLEVSDEAPIFGHGSSLDSLGLVTLTMDIEDALADHGVEVCLSDSRAMSRRQSPFRNVTTLVQFIEEQMTET